MFVVQKAWDIVEEFGRDGIVECLTLVLKSCSLVSRGGVDEEDKGEGREKLAFNEENKSILEKLTQKVHCLKLVPSFSITCQPSRSLGRQDLASIKCTYSLLSIIPRLT